MPRDGLEGLPRFFDGDAVYWFCGMEGSVFDGVVEESFLAVNLDDDLAPPTYSYDVRGTDGDLHLVEECHLHPHFVDLEVIP